MEENRSISISKTVCGSEIREPDTYPSSLYRGETVYFCTGACLKAFLGDQDRFISGEIEHPTEDE
jgi:YHS domain-containing protein